MTRHAPKVYKAGFSDYFPVGLLRYRASQTPGPTFLKPLPQLRLNVFDEHNIRNGKSSRRLQYAEGFSINSAFVGA